MATTNFNFTTFTGSETAGWNSINTLITSIDTQLNTSSRLIYLGGSTPTSGYTITWDSGNSRWAAGQIGAAGIASNAIIEAKIASDAVTSDKIAANAVGASELANDAVDTNSIVNGAVTAAKLDSTLDLTGKTVTVATASSGDSDTSVASTAFVANAVTNAITSGGSVTYAGLANDAKTYDVPTSGTGVYFTSSGDFTSASLSTASAQNPIVIANHASTPIVLSLPNTIGSEGAMITVCQTGAASVTISPKVGATATINGSTSATYLLNAQYSIITLICLSNSGSNGTWVIAGDYS